MIIVHDNFTNEYTNDCNYNMIIISYNHHHHHYFIITTDDIVLLFLNNVNSKCFVTEVINGIDFQIIVSK